MLRPFEEKDRANMIRLLRNAQVAKTYMLPDFADDAEAGKLFDRLVTLSQDESRFFRAIDLDGQAIGMINDTGIEGGMIELGYVVHPDHHNQGHATKALGEAIHFLFSKGFSTVRTGYFEENLASRRVMEKNGMQEIELTEGIEYRGQHHLCRYLEIHKG